MMLFYNKLKEESYIEAFYKSQLEMKSKYPDPFYWSSFLFLGT